VCLRAVPIPRIRTHQLTATQQLVCATALRCCTWRSLTLCHLKAMVSTETWARSTLTFPRTVSFEEHNDILAGSRLDADWLCLLVQILLFEECLSLDDIVAIEAYLDSKWALSRGATCSTSPHSSSTCCALYFAGDYPSPYIVSASFYRRTPETYVLDHHNPVAFQRAHSPTALQPGSYVILGNVSVEFSG
jgi:hypothetical protein